MLHITDVHSRWVATLSAQSSSYVQVHITYDITLAGLPHSYDMQAQLMISNKLLIIRLLVGHGARTDPMGRLADGHRGIPCDVNACYLCIWYNY